MKTLNDINPFLSNTKGDAMRAFDVRVPSFSFSSTTITAVAESDAAKALFAQMFGAGAVSIELPKSRGEDFARFCEQKGLVVG